MKLKSIMPPRPEQTMVKPSMEFFAANGCTVWRQNQGGRKYKRANGTDGYMQFTKGVKGISDIIGFTKWGRFIACELKTGTNKPTPDQSAFLESVRRAGGVSILAWSVEDVERQYREQVLGITA